MGVVSSLSLGLPSPLSPGSEEWDATFFKWFMKYSNKGVLPPPPSFPWFQDLVLSDLMGVASSSTCLCKWCMAPLWDGDLEGPSS